jgi:ABC-type nitrate/sulfonate/bicarbonate transport system permease component
VRIVKASFSIGMILLIWGAISATKVVSPLFIPPLDEFGQAFLDSVRSRELYVDIFVTFGRALVGLLLSVLLGVPIGLFLGQHQRIYDYLEICVDFFRSVPSSALFFLFVVIFGIGDTSKVAVVFYGCFLIMIVSSVYGVRPTREKKDRLAMLDVLGASPRQKLYYAALPDSLPAIFGGLRICISLSLVLVVVTEMFLSANDGLGRRIYDSYLAYAIDEMFVAICVLGILGFLVNQMALLAERRVLFWVPEDDGRKTWQRNPNS